MSRSLRRLSIIGFGLLITVATTGLGQGAVRRGAVVGGVAGAIGAGALGAVLSQAMCDAADCGGAWVEGAVPGAVLGGIGGAILGAGVGALVGGGSSAAGLQGRSAVVVLVDASAARLESNLVEQNATGIRGLAGLRLKGGLLVGPAVERLAGGGWRVTSLGATARLDPGRGAIRPFAEVDVARFDWRHPAIIATCGPTLPSCVYTPGTKTDDYLGVAGAVGASVGSAGGGWRGFALVRFHHAGGRPAGEPASTESRQIRQVAIGGELAFRIR